MSGAGPSFRRNDARRAGFRPGTRPIGLAGGADGTHRGRLLLEAMSFRSPIRLVSFASLLCLGAAAALAGTPVGEAPPVHESGGRPQAEERTVQVVFETAGGEIEVALYPDRAPISVAQFLRYVDGGHYAGASFYRATRTEAGAAFDIVQGGLRRLPMLTGDEGDAEAEPPFPPIAHETTDDTGIRNERGVLAYARRDPGTANSEFFFNLGDSRVLNTGEGGPDRDGFGYATFGRVVRGIEVLDAIRMLPTDAPTEVEVVQGQILNDPVPILRIRRAE